MAVQGAIIYNGVVYSTTSNSAANITYDTTGTTLGTNGTVQTAITAVDTRITNLVSSHTLNGLTITPATNTTISFSYVFPGLKIALVSGQILTAFGTGTGKTVFTMSGYTAKASGVYPISCYGGINAELVTAANSSVITASLSSINGDGKFCMVIPLT